VDDASKCPEGGWVIRDFKPEGNWSWSQSQEQWVEYTVQEITQIDALESVQLTTISSSDVQTLTSEQISEL
jgi:hypothetical protein